MWMNHSLNHYIGHTITGRAHRLRLAVCLLLPCTAAYAGQTPPSGSLTATNVEQPYVIQQLPDTYRAIVSHGKQVFQDNCAMCHGDKGDGNGIAAASLQVMPRNFTDQQWMANQADGGFVVAALYGIPGSAMPAFNTQLSERDIWSAVAYVRHFAPQKNLRNRYADSGDDYGNSGNGNSGNGNNVQWGRQLFERHCSGCHGRDGSGDGTAAGFFIRSPRNLTNTDWLAAYPDKQLYHILLEGVAGSPMPAFRDVLSHQQLYAVIAYVRKISGTQARPAAGAVQGRQLYENHCAMCHGINGNGQGPAANQLMPQPRDFRNPRWIHAQSDDYLAQVITSGKKGSAMPPFGALLSERQIGSLVKYIRSFVNAIPGQKASMRGYASQ